MITITPNNDARHRYPSSTVKPLRRVGGTNNSDRSEAQLFELIDREPDLEGMRRRIEAAQGDASWYYDRNRSAFDWWHARWDGQSVDGRKWATRDENRIWPWPGASDSRVRTVEMIGNEHLTVCLFALLNMKVKAEAAHPLAAMKETEQATKLLNYILFTHMSEEIYRELPLLMNWRNLYGSALLEVVWEQERRLYMQPVNLINLQALAQYQSASGGAPGYQLSVKGSQGGPLNSSPLTNNAARLDQFIQALFDPAGEELAIAIVQSASPLVTKPMARTILKDLRELRTAEIPVPEVVKSKPRWTALRPMIDLLFPRNVGDIQRSPWVDRMAPGVTETELRDLVETDHYDPNFVDELMDRGVKSSSDRSRGGYNDDWRYDEDGEDSTARYTLHHFYHRGLYDGTPAVYCTVFHPQCENYAKHETLYYAHGEYPFSGFRFEHHERPLLSSCGIAEKAYTEQQEIKKQRDMRADRTDLALNPPLLTDYDSLLKYKMQFMPGTIIPVHRNGEAEFAKPPPYDMGSVEIEKSVVEYLDRFFWGKQDDPTAKPQRVQQLVDMVLLEMKPVLRQTGALIDQYLPEETAAAVLGPNQWNRPPREMIRGRLHYTATADSRAMNPEFLNTLIDFVTKLLPMDTMGLIDRAQLVTIVAEFISVELAERLIQSPQASTQKEQQDERKVDDLMLSSGVDQEMPMGSNYQLRLQVLDAQMQTYQQNPVAARRFQQNPELIKVFQTRRNFFLRQLQQQQNAQIGRMQVGSTFSGNAALPAAS